MSRNRLGDETSPYLLQHRDNPVHWWPWGPEALATARAENKPILLSVGYAACHWCHVMAHESFENNEIADLMNGLFVNVKVDREERPDLDLVYQSALQLLGEQGGWPLTMFLTPAAEPFWGGTYFPPTPRFGRPGFPQVLQAIAGLYTNEHDKVQGNVRAISEALKKLAPPRAEGTLPPDALEKVAGQLVEQVDRVLGGIGPAPKFPQCPLFMLLWRAWQKTGDRTFHDAVTVTLDRMSQGGIYDHLGGGFARYSTDSRWLAPHFEKMLYDNAQMIDLLAVVWQETAAPLYEARVRETIGWLLREMRDQGGAFAGTLDADSEGEEGRFYVWTEAEIDRVLGDESALLKRHYDVTEAGNWEGKTILNRSARPLVADAETEERLAQARSKLLIERDKRIRPGLDDKILADWNGLMIAALARAGQAFGEAEWIDAAAAAFGFVADNMTDDDRLYHSWRAGRAAHPGTLDDYAALARAALALGQAIGDEGYLDWARRWADSVESHFRDPGTGGYFLSADDVDDVIARTQTVFDNATPSGNGMMINVLTHLSILTGESVYADRAERVIQAFVGEITRNIFPLGTYLLAHDFAREPLQIAIVGDPGADGTVALHAAARAQSLIDAVIQARTPDEPLPSGHPAAGKSTVDGRPAAYICRGPVCSPPVTEVEFFLAALAKS